MTKQQKEKTQILAVSVDSHEESKKFGDMLRKRFDGEFDFPLLEDKEHGLSLSEISREMKAQPSAVLCMIELLVQKGKLIEVGPDGKSLGLRILTVDQLNPQLFETTIPYRVTDPTLARLSIRQDDDRINGLFYLYSQEILLNP